MLYRDRTEAAWLLTAALRPYADASAVVMGVPRGGMEVAAGVARDLQLALDMLVPPEAGEQAWRLWSARRPLVLRGWAVLLIDDGTAPAAVLKDVLHGLRMRDAACIFLGVPAASARTLEVVRPLADRIVCLREAASVSLYQQAESLPDWRILQLLLAAAGRMKKQSQAVPAGALRAR